MNTLKNRHWSDWAGAAFSLLFCGLMVAQKSALVLLLLPGIVQDVIISVSFLIRRPSRAQYATWYTRAAAYGASYLFPAFVMSARHWHPQCLAATSNLVLLGLGVTCWLIGTFLCLVAVWPMRHSFSIEPQARVLVISGPYTFARHPIYLAHILQYGGILLGHPTGILATVFCAWFLTMFVRARFEEQVLESAFPEYASYRQRMGMFGPRLIPATRRSVEAAPPACECVEPLS